MYTRAEHKNPEIVMPPTLPMSSKYNHICTSCASGLKLYHDQHCISQGHICSIYPINDRKDFISFTQNLPRDYNVSAPFATITLINNRLAIGIFFPCHRNMAIIVPKSSISPYPSQQGKNLTRTTYVTYKENELKNVYLPFSIDFIWFEFLKFLFEMAHFWNNNLLY